MVTGENVIVVFDWKRLIEVDGFGQDIDPVVSIEFESELVLYGSVPQSSDELLACNLVTMLLL